MKIIISALFGLMVLILAAGRIEPQSAEGVDCSAQDLPEPVISLEDVRENAPAQFKDIVTNGTVRKCIDRSQTGQRYVCAMCGLECAIRSEYLWSFSYGGKELYIYPLHIQCEEDGIEYVPKGGWAESEIVGGFTQLRSN